uniref:Putative hemolectin n=1 Tax=Pandinus cavimanus TaxID=217261 RepID=H2CYR1_PANCV|nr:putative hemolectin [Pandinus cavimanus]
MCDVKCNYGYQLEDGKKGGEFVCDESRSTEDAWKDHPPPRSCVRICDPPCENSGRCSAGNRCKCTRGYLGKTCQYSSDPNLYPRFRQPVSSRRLK